MVSLQLTSALQRRVFFATVSHHVLNSISLSSPKWGSNLSINVGSHKRLDPSSPSRTRSLGSLPEVVLRNLITILEDTDRPAFVNCARVSRTFYLLVTPILYKTIFIDLSAPTNPLFYRGRPIHTTANSPATQARRYFSKVLYSSHSFRPSMPSSSSTRPKTGSTSHSPTPLPDRFTFTRSLSITSHRHTACRNLAPLHMPNLVELHICPRPLEHSLNACYCKHYKHGGCPRSGPACHCPLLAQIGCEEMIFGGWFSGLTGSGLGLWPSSWPQPPQRVNKVTILVGCHSGIDFLHREEAQWRFDRSHTLGDALPTSVKRLVLVSRHSRGGWADGDTYYHAPGCGEQEDIMEAGDPLLRDAIARACAGKAVEIEVVGLGEEHLLKGGEVDVAGFRLTLENYLVDQAGWDQEEARRRAQSVIITPGYVGEASEGEESAVYRERP